MKGTKNHIIKYKSAYIILAIFVTPIILGQILRIQALDWTIGNEESWVGFFGNYGGGIIGGIVAYIVANTQIKKQIENEKQKTIESSRSYISIQEFHANPKLKNMNTSYKSRVFETIDYKKIQEQTDLKSIPFHKFTIHGTPDIIMACEVQVFLNYPHINFIAPLGIVEKEEEVFIPMCISGIKTIEVDKVIVNYTTVSGEQMIYKYDVTKGMTGYWYIKNDKPVEIFSYEMRTSDWFYPNRKNI